MNTIKKHLLLAITVLLCGSCNFFDKSNDQKQKELNVGVHAWPGGGTVYIAESKGYFKKYGLKVNVQKIENFDTKRASLIGGSIDIDIANTLDQLLIYKENSFPAEIIGITDESTGGDGMVALSNYKSVLDLKGKKIAYAEASPSDFFLRYLLKKNGLTNKDVQLVPVADPQIAGNTMISKKVDAAVTYEPFLSQATKTSGISLLASTKEYPTLIPGLLIANASKVKETPEVYENFLKAWFEAVDYYYSNTEDAQKIISDGMGMQLNEVKDILGTISIQTKQNNLLMIDSSTPDNLVELSKYIAQFWKESGYIKKDIDAESFINKDLIQKINAKK